MSDKDIIILYIKEYTLCPEKFVDFEKYMKKSNEDKDTKVIVVPVEIVKRVERL